MDIYLCSTVRHLLLSLLRANERKNKSKIILILDQQHIDSVNYNLYALPNNISVEFINRKEVIKSFYNMPGCFWHKFCIVTSTYRMNNVVKSSRLALRNVFPDIDFNSSNLFLFNDRNRLSRIFRLAFIKYDLIEDGLANYIRKKISSYERFRRLLLERRVSNYKIVGDEKQCNNIYLLNPERADISIFEKVSPVEFITPEESSDFILSFFKCNELDLNETDVIVATQPISIDNYSQSGRDQKVYKALCNHLEKSKKSYSIKVHPRENLQRYKGIFNENRFIDPKIPLEVLLLLTANKPKIVSIYSTAGIGFESFCERHTLIRDTEADYQNKVFKEWDENEIMLLNRIKEI
ncbi:glycosyltransferase family 52 [Vibrio breoganii]|uniref:glycosyltransferase family 52 n=1 Tax=Vibrio breoganii TaxID=553239 RepID=UPI000300E532|nr:glycosyltransferase family 52 [Vibrio breoganii]OED98872.1 hypothetical protein A1QE_00590 [Vibrio breoganii ZF-55]